MSHAPKIQLGIDVLRSDLRQLPGTRWALVTNDTAVTSDLTLTSQALWQDGAPLCALFSPEHGLHVTAQAGESESHTVDPRTGLPVIDTYHLSASQLQAAITQLDIDLLLIDLPDVGTRYYTYASTMIDVMRSAAELGLPIVVLDRPNPLGGQIDGPGCQAEYSSFIGRANIPIRHSLTIGEIARFVAAYDTQLGRPAADLHVLTMHGWQRNMLWKDTGLPWVMPSPNLPHPTSALVFNGTALCEGTNISEGRGTTRPFELIGAPWASEQLAEQLNAYQLPGVRFRPTWFTPVMSKWAGQAISGVQLHVTDPYTIHPLRTALYLMSHLASHDFAWNEPTWEDSGPQTPYFIDLMWGNSHLRNRLAEMKPRDIDEFLHDEQLKDWIDPELLLYSCDKYAISHR
ncbi:exo-beta-N-acetylmuramidase NamZ domain-containing protein [Trueperella sp. LYQ141]|uniref:exo-beta-N-acetylmuramidase NamZ family protein n=1 Tax=Trueperella sp. LYQ141 TaxID=3391058 RepID=UPI00398328B8